MQKSPYFPICLLIQKMFCVYQAWLVLSDMVLFKIYWLERNAEEHPLILIHHQPSETPIYLVWENLPKLKGEDGKDRRELFCQWNFQFLAHG